MIKDNHKTFGGVNGAVEFFKNSGSFYRPIELEVHDLTELNEGRELGVKHFMLDNYSWLSYKLWNRKETVKPLKYQAGSL